MSITLKHFVIAAALCGQLLSTETASAGRGSFRCGRACRGNADVDINRLRSELTCAPGGFDLCLRYKVEIEDPCPHQRLELRLSVVECGRVIRDAQGRPLRIALPLRCPSDFHDDEIEFEDDLCIPIDRGAVFNPHKLRIFATVVRLNDGCVVDRSDKGVDFDD